MNGKETTKEGALKTKEHILDNIELKGIKGDKELVSLRIRGREVAKISGTNSLYRMTKLGELPEIKLEALAGIVAKGEERSLKCLLSVLRLDELVMTLLDYEKLKKLSEDAEQQFDHEETNKLALMRDVANSVIVPSGMEFCLENKELGIEMTICLKASPAKKTKIKLK